ncbi:MAG: hypothetical protein EB829_04845 [Nitrosopumilus sp. H8]|nr:MAG: hypothetical protein EB829_04845 [Nitrosopumilus sp. H8]
MKVTGFLAFAILSVSILSYGMTSASADTHLPLTAKTELSQYSDGSDIKITGNIRNFDSNSTLASGITYLIFSPEGNRVGLGQIDPADITDDGMFTKTIKSGGPVWKTGGDYAIQIHYKTSKVIVEFNYAGGAAPAPPPPPPPPKAPEPILEPEPEPKVEPEPEPILEPEPQPTCGAGTVLKGGICVVDAPAADPPKSGCLIATATYGTELAPQVQMLREIRDNTVMSTGSGASFMTVFNDVYYSFSPYVADLERENPAFREAVKAFITPMISSLAIMSLAEDGSESHVLGLGITVIALNLGMYIAAPAMIGFKVHRHIKSRMN